MSWLLAVYNFFYEIFFGCSHGNLTRPFTLRSHCYKVCLDCGKQFPYSLDKMRVLHSWELTKQPVLVAELASVPLASVPSTRDRYARNKAVA